MANLPHVKTSLGSVRTHTRKVAEEVTARWTLYFVWGIGDSGEHEQGRALDFMTYANGTVAKPGPRRDAIGEQIASYLVTNHKRLGVWYVIWDRRIWSITRPNAGWKAYTGTNPHIDHVHVSFVQSPPAYRPPEGGPAMISDADAAKIAKAVWLYQHKPGRVTRRIGGYPDGFSSAAVNFLAAADAKHNRLYRQVPGTLADILAGIASLAKPMDDSVREVLAAALADKVTTLRDTLTADLDPELDDD